MNGPLNPAQVGNAFDLLMAIRARGVDADGVRVEGNVALALRWDRSGSEVIVERFQLVDLRGRYGQ